MYHSHGILVLLLVTSVNPHTNSEIISIISDQSYNFARSSVDSTKLNNCNVVSSRIHVIVNERCMKPHLNRDLFTSNDWLDRILMEQAPQKRQGLGVSKVPIILTGFANRNFIIQFLTDARDRAKLLYVSRRLRFICKTPSLWCKVVWSYYNHCKNDYFVEHVERLCHCFLNIWGYQDRLTFHI